MSAVLAPRHAARAVVFVDRPEQESHGVRFLAYFARDPDGAQGLGNSEGEAEDDLHDMHAAHMLERDEAALIGRGWQ